MNLEQIKSIIRDILQILGTMLVSFKLFAITDETWSVIAGAIMMLVPVVWGILNHTQANAVAVVAELKSSEVSMDGRVITLHTPALARAAKEAATPLDAKTYVI